MKEKIKTILRLHPVPSARGAMPAHQMPMETMVEIIADSLARGHTVTLPLKGNSMRPFLVHRRDKALLRKPSDLCAGMVVLARVNDTQTVVLHRIIRIEGDDITLMGDGNISVTERCTPRDVIAEAYGFLRGGNQPCYTSSRRWRIYSAVWVRLLPLRRILLAVHHIIFRSCKILDD